MSRTAWINGTERLLENKDKYGMYHAFLDDKDIRWLNSINRKEKSIITTRYLLEESEKKVKALRMDFDRNMRKIEELFEKLK